MSKLQAILASSLLFAAAAVACTPSTVPATERPHPVEKPVVTCGVCAFDVETKELTVSDFSSKTELTDLVWAKCETEPAQTTTNLDVSMATGGPTFTVPDAPDDCQCACVRGIEDGRQVWSHAFKTTIGKDATDCSELAKNDCTDGSSSPTAR